MWNYFKNSGYATGYAEDEAKIGSKACLAVHEKMFQLKIQVAMLFV